MSIKTVSLNKYEDERGWLIENEDKEIKDSLKHFLVSTLKPGHVRGQHYHRRKKEWFLIVKGKVRFVFKDIITHKTEELYISEEKPQIVVVMPNLAHAIENVGDKEAILLALVNEPLDKKHPDTYPYKVI